MKTNLKLLGFYLICLLVWLGVLNLTGCQPSQAELPTASPIEKLVDDNGYCVASVYVLYVDGKKYLVVVTRERTGVSVCSKTEN